MSGTSTDIITHTHTNIHIHLFTHFDEQIHIKMSVKKEMFFFSLKKQTKNLPFPFDIMFCVRLLFEMNKFKKEKKKICEFGIINVSAIQMICFFSFFNGKYLLTHT